MRIFVLVVALFVSAGSAVAGLSEGVEAHDRGDYKEAFREFLPLAEQGIALAQFNLGLMCDKGHGVLQDYAQALKWYRKAAEQGFALAQYSLGHMYDEGHGIPQDYAQAVKWYRKAAEQGVALAQNMLGFMHVLGQWVPMDHPTAYMWFNLAAAQDSKHAKSRDYLANIMTREQIAEGQRLTREWLKTH